MGPIGCPETSVHNYHSTLRNTPEECISHLHSGGSLKSRYVNVATFDYQNLYLTPVFPLRFLGQFPFIIPRFLVVSMFQRPHGYISACFSNVASTTFAGNATEATCLLSQIPFRFGSHQRNSKVPTSPPGP
jgi:hypothetical protein